MVALSALVVDLDRELLRLGYKDSTMIWYRQCWCRLETFFADLGVEEFSLEIAMAWVDAACDFFAKEQSGTLRQTDVYLFRVAQMLGDFVAHGAVLRRYDRRGDKLAAHQAELIGKFQAALRAEGCAVSTVRTYGTLAGEFLSFVDTRGRLTECDARTVEAFVATLSGYQAKTVEQKLCAVRSFLRYADRQGLVNADVLKAVPAVKSSKQARVPSVWDTADVARILDAIDQGNPSGKRDYAIITLVTRLGLRSIDVKRLELDDFDWPGNRLWVRQTKTGHRKGGKDRQIPVSEPIRVRLAHYHAQFDWMGHEWFFPGRRGQRLRLSNVYNNFRRFLWQARISHGGRGHGPRVHDFRHSFAVHNLRNWFATGKDVGAMLPILQTYMGHYSIAADTAYYLRLTAESYPHIVRRLDEAIGHVVPCLKGDLHHGN